MLSHPHPDIHLSLEEIVLKEGFNLESHYVHTDDGYINKVFRINNHKLEPNSSNSAVLMVHGLMDSSDTWITNGRDNSPAFILA